ncbi:MAG: dihydrodipicolinate synthase family protein [Azospirillaceae bacterium]
MRPTGIHAFQYALFGRDGSLDPGLMARQVELCVSAGASGVAVLGLGTEVHKLSAAERRTVVEWTAWDLGGRLPLAVTCAETSVDDQVDMARVALANGASWIILQPPPSRGGGEAGLVEHFARVAGAVDAPVAIQNAPEFLGHGLSAAGFERLRGLAPNVTIVKAEGTAVSVARMAEALGDGFAILNGRCGLELVENLRGGCCGMMPATETIDLQTAIFAAHAAGDADRADALYERLAPAVSFVMQGIDHFLLYGKMLLAARLGLDPVPQRQPADVATEFGAAVVRRLAARLGPL